MGSLWGFIVLSVTSLTIYSCTSLISLRLPSSLPQAPGPEVRVFANTPNGLEVPPDKNVLRLKYKVNCQENQYMAPGYLLIDGKQYNFHLLRPLKNWDIYLPPLSSPETKIFVYSTFLNDPRTCEITKLNYEFLEAKEIVPDFELKTLILEHAPVVSIRYDLLNNPFDDIPLMLGYTINRRSDLPLGANFEIVYQLVFSDQDAGKSTISDIRAQSARWGRRYDMEWIYRVAFDKNGKVVQQRLLKGLVDFTKVPKLSSDYENRPTAFRGKYLPGTQRPILYNTGRHHNFDIVPRRSYPATRQQFYSLVPMGSYEYPNPREDLIFQNAWILNVNESELKNRGVLEDFASDYLYVKLFGNQKGQEIWRPYVYLNNSKAIFPIGRGEGSMRHFDRSLWNQATYAMIYLGEENIAKILENKEKATIYLDKSQGPVSTWIPPKQSWDKIQIEKIEIFRLLKKDSGYELQNISRYFECTNALKNLTAQCKSLPVPDGI